MDPKGRGWIFATAILLLSICCQGAEALTNTLTGRRAPCGNEGEPVAVDHIDKSRCFSCICKNGFVECKSEYYCPPIDGCHMLVEKTDDGCCQKCKGCIHNGVHHQSHTEWTDPSEPCKVMRCEAGVITESDMQCHTPCSNPLPPLKGQCCPTCPECKINGQVATDDRDVTSDDPCLKCRCIGGRMTCSKKACPVLQCPLDRQYLPPNECCPKCTGTRILMTVPKTCTVQTSFFREGQSFNIDRCTNCTCRNETSVCRRSSCPILNCPSHLHKKNPGSCCPHCVMPEEVKTQCSYAGKVYEDGQSWQLNACSSCKCNKGMSMCAMTRCNVTLPCSPGSRIVHVPGECCEKCEEIEGVCMVFGDPHYKTFDGKIYSFQGIGKYQLVADCHKHSFWIRVANHFPHKNSKYSTFTKRIAIKAGDIRVNLGQRLRIKVNGQKIRLPYKKEGQLNIERVGDSALVTLHNGVKIFWSGKSFVEVTVPASFKNKLCGLCGNFNSNVQDDFKLRKGSIVRDNDTMNFGLSWCVGTKESCLKQANQTAKIRPCKAHRVERNPCKYLMSTELFNGCDSKLNYNKYYKACMMDMCNCPNGKCYCESLMAYARECERLGVEMPNWQRHSYCTANNLRQRKLNKISTQYTLNDIERLRKLALNRTRSERPPILIH